MFHAASLPFACPPPFLTHSCRIQAARSWCRGLTSADKKASDVQLKFLASTKSKERRIH